MTVMARSTCTHCGSVIETTDSPDAAAAVWTSVNGVGVSGRTRECRKAPNPDEGPMPDHRPGIIARRPTA